MSWRPEPGCTAPGCENYTREAKPFCADHLALCSPYVAGLIEAVAAGRVKQSRRPVFRHACTICSGAFVCASVRALYCGDLCRDVARDRRGREAS